MWSSRRGRASSRCRGRSIVDERVEFFAEHRSSRLGVAGGVDLMDDAQLIVDHLDQALVESLEHRPVGACGGQSGAQPCHAALAS